MQLTYLKFYCSLHDFDIRVDPQNDIFLCTAFDRDRMEISMKAKYRLEKGCTASKLVEGTIELLAQLLQMMLRFKKRGEMDELVNF